LKQSKSNKILSIAWVGYVTRAVSPNLHGYRIGKMRPKESGQAACGNRNFTMTGICVACSAENPRSAFRVPLP